MSPNSSPSPQKLAIGLRLVAVQSSLYIHDLRPFNATRYGLNGPGIESGGSEIFRTRPDRPWGPPSLLSDRYRVFPGGKAARAWRWPPTPSSAEVKKRVELYLYSTSGPSWPVLRWTLHPFNRAISKWILEKQMVTVWARLRWFTIEFNGSRLCT